MKIETMFYIALGKVVDDVAASEAFADYASTADATAERNHYTRRALKYKTKAIVNFDREMDRLVKDYK